MSPMKGKLISLEGIWGSGKTTQSNLLCSRLKNEGYQVEVVHYGGQTGSQRKEIGKAIEQEVDYIDPVRRKVGSGGFDKPYHAIIDILLRFSREAYDIRHMLRPALERNQIVILDRGIDTIVAYCLATIKENYPNQNLRNTFQWLKNVMSLWSIIPDLTILFDTSWRKSIQRVESRDQIKVSDERVRFYPKFQEAYDYVAAEEKRVIKVISGGDSITDISDIVWITVERFLKS